MGRNQGACLETRAWLSALVQRMCSHVGFCSRQVWDQWEKSAGRVAVDQDWWRSFGIVDLEGERGRERREGAGRVVAKGADGGLVRGEVGLEWCFGGVEVVVVVGFWMWWWV